MKTSIKNITQVWYEIELDSQNISERSVAEHLWLDFATFKKTKWHSLMIKMSHEYYNSTIEFNFLKEKFTLNLHKKIKKFTNFVMKKFNLNVYWTAPSFVWTHIHFFRSGLNTVSPDKILKITLWFILDNIDDLHIKSLERLIRSHQLWWHYACNNPVISELLQKWIWKNFSYPEQSRNRPKYRPVIHSPRSTTWKLRSTEIRFIPTEFILNDKVLDLFNRLDNLSPVPNEDIPVLYNNLIKIYKWLTKQQNQNENEMPIDQVCDWRIEII